MRDKPGLLCVDDEQAVLDSLAINLHRDYDVRTATSGARGLELLQEHPSTAVVMSDMRMPVMDGASFLAAARALRPETTRILLTGQADMTSAIAAINDGQIFRFLVKPCPIAAVAAALAAATAQHRLVTAERELLQETLNGSIQVLTDVLGMTHPAAFGRASRIKMLVRELVVALGGEDRWQVELAAMFSQLGSIALPDETADKLYRGRGLNDNEKPMLARLPEVTEQLLARIPRLESVRGILRAVAKPRRVGPQATSPAQAAIERSAEILRLALDFDALQTRESSVSVCIETLRGRAERYDPEVLDALPIIREVTTSYIIRELPVSGLRVGMTFLDEIRLANGVLLVARGYEVTDGLLERLRNLPRGAIAEPVRVRLPEVSQSTRAA